MKILSVHYGHNATIGLLKDGEVVFCQSEERLNGLKNSTGWPELTLKVVYKKFGSNIDLVVLPNSTLLSYAYLKNSGFKSQRYLDLFSKTRSIDFDFIIRYLFFKYFPNCAYSLWRKKALNYANKINNDKKLQAEAKRYFSQAMDISEDKIIFLNHHEAHAYATAFNINPQKETIVFTLDSEGDEDCATVGVLDNGNLKILSRIQRFNSLGELYSEITGFLGMKPNEDEYKVMGLAPYAKVNSKYVKDICSLFKEAIKLNDKLEFEAKFSTSISRYYLFERLIYERFDNVAAGIQQFLEEIVTEWVSGWVKKTGIRDISLGGGVFMNVKLDQKLAEIPEVHSIFVMPSSGDESTVFGCLFYGYKNYCMVNNVHLAPQPLTHLYLGEDLNEDEVKTITESSNINAYSVSKPQNIECKIAELLAKNEIVARCAGCMEWGARALGNRSILANPSSLESVRIINEMIKNRDFWMPFAPSVLEEDFSKYFKNPKNIYAPYMTTTFDSTELARKQIIAGLHPYDFTGRPQVVRKSWNSSYYFLISEFKKQTGIGAVLNTSFNLHGEPLVRGAGEAIKTFMNSGLKYLALGSYLLKKN
jgi:carbamoyltransferase